LKTQGLPNGSFASLNPVLLFRMTDKIFAEAELEFGFEDGGTATGLEYATVHYLANDYLTVSAGKFLVPFGVFSQRLHPSWINRFNSMPPFYGHRGGIPGVDPLLPVIGDIGAMVSTVAPLGGVGRSLTFSGYVTNGPRVSEHDMGRERPDFAFGAFSGDNNNAKMVGGRVGLVLAPGFELDLSALRSKWGEGEMTPNLGTSLFLTGYNVAAEYRPVAALELRTEWMWLRTGVEHMDTTTSTSEIETQPQFGGYAQAALRQGAWEPVLRLGLVNINQAEENERLTQYGVGLNYWLSPSVAVMAAFELNRDHFNNGADMPNNRFLIHWAFGF